MCIVFWKETKHHHIILGNRDEFLSRPTTSATWHNSFSEDHKVLSGLDLEAGGTWLGLSIIPSSSSDTSPPHPSSPSSAAPIFRFATLTNFTEPMSKTKSIKPSRGALVKDYLVDDKLEMMAHLEKLDRVKNDFAGFNLVIADWDSERGDWKMGYCTNRDDMQSRRLDQQNDGLASKAVSNSTLEPKEGDSLWPKIISGCTALDKSIAVDEDDEGVLVNKAWELLSTANPAPILDRTHLRQTILVRPVFMDPFAPLPSTPPPFESAPSGTPSPRPEDLSPSVTNSENAEGKDGYWYGTRVQSIVLIDKREKKGRALFVERDAYEMDENERPRWSGKVRRFEIKDWVQ